MCIVKGGGSQPWLSERWQEKLKTEVCADALRQHGTLRASEGHRPCLPPPWCSRRHILVSRIASYNVMSNNKAEGRREDALVKQRTQLREEFERQKQNLIQETEKARPSSNRFVGQNDSMEDTLKQSTVGLVRLEDFQQRRKELEEAKAREAARTNELKYVVHSYSVVCKTVACRATSLRTDCLPDVEGLFRDEKKVKKRKKTAKSTLSFAMDDEGDESGSPSLNDDEPPVKRPKSRKNPEVDTSFLPDREREEAERREREQLRQEWLRKQDELKKEDIEITYSYWDGSGHRKSVMVSLQLS